MAIFHNIESLPAFTNAVITIGTFDGVHKGHRTILQEVVRQAKNRGGESILLTFEPHPRKLLYPNEPLQIITPLPQKLALVQETGIDHIVVVPFTKAFAQLSAEDYIREFLIKKFHPAAIVIGYDHHFGHDRAGNINMLQSFEAALGYKTVEIPAQLIEQAAVSSTKIRKALQAGQVAEAATMLGREYALKGTVVAGAQLGRTIGYPTANIVPNDADQLVPGNGVYAIRLIWNDNEYPGMLNIGIRPTVSQEHKRHIEAHLFRFSDNLYDQEVVLCFVERLRDEKKFASLDALKQQLAEDNKQALALLEASS